MLYFSYGSNMSLNRIIGRVPSAKVIGIGILKKHQLKFHKISKKDGSGKCGIYENGKAESEVGAKPSVKTGIKKNNESFYAT